MKTLNIQNIVVPIDFSKMSVQTIPIAEQLARRFGASIHLAHVHHFNYAADFVTPAPPVVPFSFMPYEQNGQGTALKRLNKLANDYGVPSGNCHVLSGAPAFDEICRLTQTIPADLVVMPTHGRTGLKHVFLGSTAERVVQHSPCPVFIVRKPGKRPAEKKDGIRTILVPVDFSHCSREGFRYAVAFANQFGARIILIHATYLGYIYSAEGNAIYDVRGLQDAARENAEKQMRQLLRTVNSEGVKIRTVITEGSPVVDICAFAKDHEIDLIITSTHGLTGFEHLFMGSVAEKLVRHALCSVLVVPSHPQIRTARLARSRNNAVRARSLQGRPAESPKANTLTKKDRRMMVHAFPERRKTNKFRESHLTR